MLPVLLIHGIWDTGAKLADIARALERQKRIERDLADLYARWDALDSRTKS